MTTIEERANRAIYEPTDGHPLKACEVVAFARGYELGATEQKAIDIDKACEIVRNIANEYFGDWEQSCKVEDTFRKAMEE